jgi:hypothetical protein
MRRCDQTARVNRVVSGDAFVLMLCGDLESSTSPGAPSTRLLDRP